MKQYHFFAIFLLIMAAGLGIFVVANQGLYPVAIVDYSFITAKTWSKHFDAASQYYTLYLNVKNLSSEAAQEIKRATLDKLIENVLVYKSLREIAGPGSEILVADRMQKLNLERDELREATSMLYGITFEEFKQLALLPEARREILESRLLAENRNFNEWLVEIKANASVILLTPQFSWNGKRVENGN